jgi:hypothetical protein
MLNRWVVRLAAFMNANPALAQQMNVARELQGAVNPYQAYNNAVSGGQPNLATSISRTHK